MDDYGVLIRHFLSGNFKTAVGVYRVDREKDGIVFKKVGQQP